MANIDPAPSWANIRRLETTDRNMAGPGGILNDPTTSIAARLNLLRDNDTTLGNSVAAVNARQDATDTAIANIQGQVLTAPGTLSDLENGAPIDPAAAFPDVPSVENSLGPVDAINRPIEALAARSKNLNSNVEDILETGVTRVLSEDNYTSDLMVFSAKDEQGADRILGRFRPDGSFESVLSASVDGLLPLAGGYVNVSENYGDDIEVLITPGTPYPRVIRRTLRDGSVIDYGDNASDSSVRQEVIDARGTTDSLSSRLAATIRPDGLSPSPYFNGFALSETRRLLQGLRAADTAAAPFVISTITDSWGDNRNYWLQAFSTQIKAKFGNAGVGFMPVDRGGPDTLAGTLTRSGDWAIANRTGPGPGLISASSSTTGSSFTITGATGGTASICFEGGTGVVRYRYDAGTWTNVSLDGSGVRYAALGTPPSGTWTLVVEVVSGECVVYGFDVRTSVRGVRINKLGAGGSRLSEWVSQDLTQWAAGFSPLGSNLVIILFGTNDAYYYSAEAYGDYARQMVGRVRTASPLADILLVSPPQNLGTATVSQFDQAYVLREVASQLRCAHLDLQQYFGSTVSAYDGASRDYMNASDPSHPTPKGGAIITEVITRLISQD